MATEQRTVVNTKDEINFTILLDNKLTEELRTISPFYNIPDTSKPYSVGGYLSLQPPANLTLSAYLEDASEDTVNDTVVSKLKLEA